MSFFTLSNGQQAEKQTTFEMGGGDFAPIPENSKLHAYISEAKWGIHDDEAYINLKWEVISGEFTGRKLFQKIKVNELDAAKRDKAIRMLAAIDTNCGGKLQQLGTEPDDMNLAVSLMQKPMFIIVGVWELDDKSKSGNWVKAVSSAKKATTTTQQVQQQQTNGHQQQAQTQQQVQQQKEPSINFDDDIPF